MASGYTICLDSPVVIVKYKRKLSSEYLVYISRNSVWLPSKMYVFLSLYIYGSKLFRINNSLFPWDFNEKLWFCRRILMVGIYYRPFSDSTVWHIFLQHIMFFFSFFPVLTMAQTILREIGHTLSMKHDNASKYVV